MSFKLISKCVGLVSNAIKNKMNKISHPNLIFHGIFRFFSHFLYFILFFWRFNWGRKKWTLFHQMEGCEKMLQSFYLHRNAFSLSLQFIARFAAATSFDFLFPFMHVIWKVCLCNGFVIKVKLFIFPPSMFLLHFYIALQQYCVYMPFYER